MEISHFFGQDLTLTAYGDIAQTSGDELTKQSIIRRLLTNPGSYIWHPNYGAGIGRFVGQSLSANNFETIKNLMRSQILNEETVAKTPSPQITLSISNNTVLICDIVYTDAITNQAKAITLRVS